MAPSKDFPGTIKASAASWLLHFSARCLPEPKNEGFVEGQKDRGSGLQQPARLPDSSTVACPRSFKNLDPMNSSPAVTASQCLTLPTILPSALPLFHSSLSFAGPWFRRVIRLTAVFLPICLGACVNLERQASTVSPLSAAELRLARAEKQKSDVTVQGAEYLGVAEIAQQQLASAPPSDPTRSSALRLYNRASADLAGDLPELIEGQPNSKTLVLTEPATGQVERLRLESGRRGEYSPAYFQKILAADQIDQRRMPEHATRDGLGGTVVGVHRSSGSNTSPPRLEPQKGIRATMTAVVDAEPLPKGEASIRLMDPTTVDTVALNQKSYALAGDYTAAQASYGRINQNWIGLMNMIRGENMRGTPGLLLTQPYNSEKIPVIFVHGLLSSAYVWQNVASSLTADPGIRRHYQFWVFSYSTGNPITYSALLLRRDLAYAEDKYHFKQVILIGHSMGGILSRLQVTSSGRVLWDGVFGANADQLYASQPANSTVKQALLFSPNPIVKRVVFIATPHRGSSLSTGFIGALGIKLIRLPIRVLEAVPHAVVVALAPNNDPRKFRPPTSISGLSPKNPLLISLDKLPIDAPHNSIIGDRGRGDTPKSSDGVVPYWSSHLDSAQSELIVPTGHGAMDNPKSVQEIRRILLEQIDAIKPQKEVVPKYGNSLLPADIRALITAALPRSQLTKRPPTSHSEIQCEMTQCPEAYLASR
jgi:pimeloyl-ACP methyl ester carboxylesterase